MPPKAPAAKLPTKNGNLMPVGFNADPSTTAVTVTLSNDAVPLFTRGKNTKKDLPFLSAVVVPAVIGLCAKAQDANIRVRTTDHRAFIIPPKLLLKCLPQIAIRKTFRMRLPFYRQKMLLFIYFEKTRENGSLNRNLSFSRGELSLFHHLAKFQQIG